VPEQPPPRPGGRLDPPEGHEEDGANTKPLDITELDTDYLVPPGPPQRIRASREEQLVAHQAAMDHLREQQAALVREVVDWQDQLVAEPTLSGRRVEIKQHIDSLWAIWSELERQIGAHRQAVRALRDPDPPPQEQGG
jgi:hypothetical protein